MPIKVQLTALAVGLAIAGIAVLRHQRRVLKRDRYSKLAVAIASHMVGVLLLPAVAVYALAESAERRRVLIRLVPAAASAALVFAAMPGPWLTRLPAEREAWRRLNHAVEGETDA